MCLQCMLTTCYVKGLTNIVARRSWKGGIEAYNEYRGDSDCLCSINMLTL